MNFVKSLKTLLFLVMPVVALAQPEQPVSEWQDKTVLVVGAHPDDDSYAYGTMAMLRDHGNEVYVLLMTTGNVGTKDPNMTRDRLSKIRRQEELHALKILDIAEDHYINLGYTDGMLEFANKEEVVKQLVYYIRKIKPDVLIAFDPGYGYQRWRKSDHRAASYLAADAARAAEWRLLFPAQINHQGLEAHLISEYLFFDPLEKDIDTWVDISGYKEDKINASAQHVSQFSSAWEEYRGPKPEDLPEADRQQLMERMRSRVQTHDGMPVEGFRYYKGIPDGIGKR